ncbi:MAG: branched-chain amino acid ABC transporter permease [Nitrospiraceae bacterium]|nr:branched-chain amino acid ABC transporter permease [Nitrospiraceae bacterium]
MDTVIVTTINLTAIYTLVALGISLTWAGLGFLNMSAGVMYAGAAYGAWLVSTEVSSNVVVVLLGGILTGAVFGAVVCLTVFIPLDGKPNWEIRTLTATLALSFIGTNIYLWKFGPQFKQFEPLFSWLPKFRLGEALLMPSVTGSVIATAVVVTIILVYIGSSRIGLGVRALTQNVEGAALVGIDRRTVAFAILGVSGAFIGLAAVLLGQTFFVEPNSGYVPLIKGLIVAVLGGLGSLRGAVIAAFLVALCEALTLWYFGGSWVLVTLFLLISIVLIIRPRGVAGLLETTRA